METTQTAPEWRTAADEIWALVRENARGLKELRESQEKTAERIDRQMKETDRRMKETDRQMKETDRQLGKLGNRFGQMIEYMVIPNLLTKFRELEFTFTKANRTSIEDREHNIFIEIDAYLENGEETMSVEIKSKPCIDDIKDHVERMGKLRKYADLHNDRRVYLGAVAGVVFGENEKNYALKNGFYVIEPSGETFKITKPEGEYQPRRW